MCGTVVVCSGHRQRPGVNNGVLVEGTRPGLPGLSSLSLNLRGLGLQKGPCPSCMQLLNQPGVALLLLYWRVWERWMVVAGWEPSLCHFMWVINQAGLPHH
jgi:hypothetical protein